MSSSSHDRLTLRGSVYRLRLGEMMRKCGKIVFLFYSHILKGKKTSKSFSAQIVSHGFAFVFVFLHGMWFVLHRKKVLFWLSCFHCLTTFQRSTTRKQSWFGFKFRIVMCVYNLHNIPFLPHLFNVYMLFTVSPQLPHDDDDHVHWSNPITSPISRWGVCDWMKKETCFIHALDNTIKLNKNHHNSMVERVLIEFYAIFNR